MEGKKTIKRQVRLLGTGADADAERLKMLLMMASTQSLRPVWECNWFYRRHRWQHHDADTTWTGPPYGLTTVLTFSLPSQTSVKGPKLIRLKPS